MEIASHNGIETSFREIHVRQHILFPVAPQKVANLELQTQKISNNNFVASFACQKLFGVRQSHRRARQSWLKGRLILEFHSRSLFGCGDDESSQNSTKNSSRFAWLDSNFPFRFHRQLHRVNGARICVNRALLLLRTINKLLSFYVFFSQPNFFALHFLSFVCVTFWSERKISNYFGRLLRIQ